MSLHNTQVLIGRSIVCHYIIHKSLLGSGEPITREKCMIGNTGLAKINIQIKVSC